ncbi:MAG: hypothetical protein HY471_00270 [Candidatus Sungbacteria bacterium]|nr:hypothetical protein [Candidatus Sungbacteria bacterium]
MLDLTLTGTRYSVTFQMMAHESTHYSRGDHYAGDGEYTVRHGKGEVTIRDHDGQCLAVCGLAYSHTDAHGRLRGVNDEIFRKCIEVEGLLPEMKEKYADWLGEQWIDRFRSHRGLGMPCFALEPPDPQTLIQNGFILDPSGQASLPLPG